MSWASALGRGVTVVLYFVVTTVWLPDFVLGLGAMQTAADSVRDIVVLAVWGGALVGGMFLLRRSQDRGLI